MNPYQLISTPTVSSFRRDARQRSRSTELSYCQALDAVARDHEFAHWKEVMTQHSASVVAECAFRNGLVIAMDSKEGEDIHASSGFVHDPLIDALGIERMVALILAGQNANPLPADSATREDYDGLEDTVHFTPESAREWVSHNNLFFRYAGDQSIESTQAACEYLCSICFWRPIYMWFRGEHYDGQWINDRVYPRPNWMKTRLFE